MNASVPVKSAWASKINWTNVLGGVGTIIVALAAGFDAPTSAAILTGWSLLQNVLSVVFRTWFNASVAPQSLS